MSDPTVQTSVVNAALALAAHYFPRRMAGDARDAAGFADAAFLLSGKYTAWDRWSDLTHDEKQRIALLGSVAPADLAEHRAFSVAARTALVPQDPGEDDEPGPIAAFELAGANPFTADAAFPRVGGNLLDYADRQTARFRRPSARPKPPDFAGPGTWITPTIYVKDCGQISGRVSIPRYPHFTEAFDLDRLPHVSTVAHASELRIPKDELLALAAEIDERFPTGKRFLHTTLSGLFEVLQTSDTVSPADVLTMSAGGLEIFHAPTGTGKSVLVRVLASWFALNNLRLTIVQPDIKACLAMTWNIQGDLAHLQAKPRSWDHTPSCAHLMSTSSMQDRAVKHASLIDEDPEAPGDWGLRGQRDIDPLAYGCAQREFTEATGDYPPGREPCLSLTRQGVGASACPWIPTCSKFTPVYQACDANVVVMNHFLFLQGTLRIGINLDGRPVYTLTAAEFALRTCHAVLIDEVDQFQSRAIDRCASDVKLHSRRHWTSAPQAMDTDAKRLPIDDENELLPSVSHVRLMAEFLLLSICRNSLKLTVVEDARAKDRVPDQTSSRWHMARGRDRTLAALMWPDLDLGDAGIPTEVVERINALMPERYRQEDRHGRASGTLESVWADVQRGLSALVGPRGELLLDAVKIQLHELLSESISDGHRRAQIINLLATRAVMIELDEALAEVRSTAQRFRSSGLRSAQKIIDQLQNSAITAVMPIGMLGRSLTGYRVTGLDDKERSAELVAQTIGGDPHLFTSELGGIVSLSLAGVERPVMGLSATAFFPQAVREHVNAPVRWWMTDAQARSIRARKRRIEYGKGHPLFGEPIKVSGLHPSRKRGALIELGDQLYDRYIRSELEKAVTNDPDRAHVLVVANSYDQCAWIARGISESGSYREGLCVAVHAEDRHSHNPELPRENRAVRLTSEEFETFPDRGNILVVPLSVIARGLNIVKGIRSAVRSVYLCVRPLALLSEPSEMYASINAAGIRALPAEGSSNPIAALAGARDAAWDRLRLLLRSANQFTSMQKSLQEEVVAGMIVDLIQLAGRARRGGTEAVLHMVDHAFHEDTWSADLDTILRRIHAKWPPDVRAQMNDLYGEALNAFLSYAGIDPTEYPLTDVSREEDE
ncbi:hypothetical protein OWR29_39475 [Actinoplanes sp. Pm04-4]|uniref:Helicase n=1 Tax=Paractinoplanes pyxinae TaxID=2997416 RepID=A0ABT4BC68_9ACTN|nr:hypothetical protein [Actinoplanes pyxinae]MCY1144113.1 hypothetical protein [Actinoplanes pyxinae]